MAARIQREISLLVISLIAAVISLPVAASVASAIEVKTLAPITQSLKSPVRIALDGDGTAGFYVTDPRNGAVLKYDASGVFQRKIKTSGSPQGVAVMANGNLVVTMGRYAAIVDKVTGLDVKRLGTAGVETTFGFADGVAVDGTGAIFVADAKNSKFLKFDNTGEFIQSYGKFGDNGSVSAPTNDGDFYSPAGVTYDSVGNRIAITDVMLGNVKFFALDGTPQGMVGGGGPDGGKGKFVSPMGVAFEYVGSSLSRTYVVDSFQSSVQVLDAAGAHLAYIGDYGSENGKLMVPTDVVYDKINKRLIVANGYGNITVYGIDGGKTPAASTVVARPTLTVNQPLSIVNSSSLTLSGTISSNATVSCALNGVKAFPANISGSNWNCSLTGLSQGGNSIDVVARNSSPTEVKESYLVTYALGGPNLTVNPVAQYIKVNPLPVSGTVDIGSTVQVCNPVATCNNATVDGSGNWSYSVAVTPGANTITVKAVNVGTSTKTVDTILDNTPPVLTVSSVPTGSTVARQVVNISGSVEDSNISSVTVDGQAVALVNSRFSYPVVGKASFDVVATDLANNTTTQTIALSYDPNKVAVDFTSHADGAVVRSTPQTINGTLTASLGTVTVNGESVPTVGGTTWSKSVALTQGINTIVVDAGGAKSKLTLVYDPTNPAVTVSDPVADKATNTDTKSLQLTGVVGENVLLSSVVGGVETEQSSNIPFALPLSQEGVYPVVLKAKDQLTGYVSQTVRNIIYDLTPPALTVNSASGDVVTLSGTVEPGAAVKVLNLTTGQAIATASVAYTGTTWTATLGATLPSDNIDISATDAAGNVTSKTSFRPDGNINIDPTDLVVNDLDAEACLDIVVGAKTATRYQLAHGDIGPLVGGLSSPNGRIDVSDCVLILRKASGLPVTW